MVKVNQQNIRRDKAFYQGKIAQLTQEFDKLKTSFQDVAYTSENGGLSTLDNDTYRLIMSMEKDIELLKDKVVFLKDSTVEILKVNGQKYEQLNTDLQEFSGAVNQLKMAVNKLQENQQNQKQVASNWFWQVIIPILLAIVFFVFGLFTKSCSAVIPEIQRQTQKSLQQQYINLQPENNK